MAYNEFAYFYDEFNGEADYDALYSQIHTKLEAHGIHDGIVADLGCGTGELTLMLRTCSSWISTVPSGQRYLPLIPSTTSRIWIPPLPTRAFSWKRAACSCLI